MFRTVVVFQGEEFLGEVEIYPYSQPQLHEQATIFSADDVKEIRISHFSDKSERCPPLAVLHSITSSGVCFKMASKSSQSQDSPLHLLHSSCARENKTAVMALGGGQELHLVAMYSRNNDRYPCFWGFNVASGLYDSCLVMLNLRCLGIVFDLDETLIVANTMRSFEDRIEALQRKLNTEVDPQRLSGILSEVKRYQEDKNILKQYVENDQVKDNNGKVFTTQSEIIPALSDSYPTIVRPLIRLQDKNIILTRINPLNRDTSVLVRLRPAWEDLRSYLTARGRKRFEVYVCTMAERDYALEMWRLLDPDSNLINSKELLDRIVCVKSGLRKSLFNVFQNGICDPKMALVIDDRLKVWDEKDQPRVHVVPAFAPYYAPQAEANNAVPVLCVARNVACNIRGGFFKEFDDGLLQKIPGVAYEDDLRDIPSPPDVSNYLVSEDDTSVSNRDTLAFDGMADVEVEKRLKEAVTASPAVATVVANIDPRLAPLQFTMASSSNSVPLPIPQASIVPFPSTQFPQTSSLVRPLGAVVPPEPSVHSSPAREEGEVPESELDPDTRRRLLILQHGQDTREHTSSEPPFPVRPPLQVPVPRAQSRGGWYPVEEEISPRQMNRTIPKEYPLDSETTLIEKHRPHHPSFFPKVESAIPPDRIFHENQRLPKVALQRDDRFRLNHSFSGYQPFSGDEIPFSQSSSRDLDFESGRDIHYAETPVGALHEIALKCRTKVEFRPALVPSTELQFSIEAWLAGEKIGEGVGKTRREAQHQASENSLKNLANVYISRAKPDSSSVHGDVSRFPNANDNGFMSNLNSFGNQSLPKEESVSYSTVPETSRVLDPRLEGCKKVMGAVSTLKELCMVEGFALDFQEQPAHSVSSSQKDEVHVQVEIDGQVLGKGVGLTWDEAKMQAAEKALANLRSSMYSQIGQKRQSSPRPMQGMFNKRLKPEFARGPQRMPSARFPKNASVP